jgi:hypothetical protein
VVLEGLGQLKNPMTSSGTDLPACRMPLHNEVDIIIIQLIFYTFTTTVQSNKYTQKHIIVYEILCMKFVHP